MNYEINEIVEMCKKMCNANSLCDGSCVSVPKELSQYYDNSEYANIIKNYMIYFLDSKFRLYQRNFNKKSGCS